MDFKEIIRDSTGTNNEISVENFIQRRIRRFKENIIFNLIFLVVTLGILFTVGIYLFIVITKAIK